MAVNVQQPQLNVQLAQQQLLAQQQGILPQGVLVCVPPFLNPGSGPTCRASLGIGFGLQWIGGAKYIFICQKCDEAAPKPSWFPRHTVGDRCTVDGWVVQLGSARVANKASPSLCFDAHIRPE